MKQQTAEILNRVREQSPLVHAITNYVTMGDCANILLAYGASPAMVEAMDETYDFATISGAFYLNLGTFTKEQEAAAIQAVLGANAAGKPVIVDPAGCGAVPRKVVFLDHLRRIGRISLIKGNIGEINTLAGCKAQVRGVDSTGGDEGIEEAVKLLAERFGCVVAATGERDAIGDGKQVIRLQNGVEMLTKVTGAGCMLGALCAATAAVAPEEILAATVCAHLSMGIAGEHAFEKAKLPGSFRVALMDAIYELDPQMLLQEGNLIC